MARIKPDFDFETVYGGFLTKRDVDDYLESAFAMLLDLATDSDVGRWSPAMFDDLAERLFDYAVNRFIDEPPQGDLKLGTWSVPALYRAQFVERIQGLVKPLLPEFEGIIADVAAAPKWKDPNPQVIVEEFMDEMGFGQKKFKMLREWFKFAGKLEDKVTAARLDTHPELSAEHQFLTRHIFRIRFESVVTDHHVNLASFIRSRSKKYADVEPIQLTWRPQ